MPESLLKLDLSDSSLLREDCFVAGEWVSGSETIGVHNPASGQLVAHVPKLGTLATRAAIEGADRALPAWRRQTAQSRAAVLRRWADLMLKNREDLARIMTAEQGKPLAEARSEIGYAASFLEWFAEEGKRVYGETVPAPIDGQRIVVLREPVGVCAAITPWNFPAAMITRKVAPALAVGCTMVLKPASQTPLSALALAVLAERAGVPAGAFSVVTGSAAEIGSEMCSSSLVRKLSFTGSTEIGRQLMAQTASTVKKVSMELGGNAPFIVFADADLDRAVEGAISSKFRNAGQTCVCTNRIYVHRSVIADFSQRLVNAVQQLKVGDGCVEGVNVGPLIDESAVRKVEEHIADAVRHGARVLAGGRRHSLGGFFFEPTVLADVTQAMAVAHEETFGPLAPLFQFDSDEEVLSLANATEFGLASYFYTRDLARAWRFAGELEHGMVGVNTGLISNEVAPFGGIKQSGVGREGSRHGIDDYLVTKYVNFAGL